MVVNKILITGTWKMKIDKISEYGHDESALGFSLSYNSTPERAKQIFKKYAFGVPGEGKFLEMQIVYLDVTAPRYWWSEADTYRLTTKQSESTMHTITKRMLNHSDFEDIPDSRQLDALNYYIYSYQESKYVDEKKELFLKIKNMLPEGFLQRRIWMVSYKALQNIIHQRKNHRLPQWGYFCNRVLNIVDHPEYLEKSS